MEGTDTAEVKSQRTKGWAAGAGYGEKILKILDAIKETGSSQAGDGSPKPDETKKDDDFKEYLITTTCDVLNIRSGAGTDNKVVGGRPFHILHHITGYEQ